ncbi:mechanosensitive ion channel family protein [Flammeovirga pectinis]|uniref:Mechanosensitive ion channel family protein n=1 Tax=Flammeovirga pectinis TaxID=2494373 RepID=A0A3S9NY64_9BACT|nr:mechanosensitive ion channel family protein [Flammeovirga pectinis]AZQ60892.1 mechanosensitive ion channel family protein [Flammeovirga pectinis]
MNLKFILFLHFYLYIVFTSNANELDSLSFNDYSSVSEKQFIEEAIIHPLNPPNTSSPRATIVSFINNMKYSHQILKATYLKNIELPGYFISDSIKEEMYQAELIFDRATDCLDLSSFPPSIQKDMSFSRAIMLKEILDRIPIPDLEKIPNKRDVEYDLENKKHPQLSHWRIPKTEIILVKQATEDSQGQYLFSKETVERIPGFYEEIKHLPYKSENYISKNFYPFYISTPGLLIPPKWISLLPDWSTTMLLNQTIWQWSALLFFIAISIGVAKVLHYILIELMSDRSAVIKQWSKVLFITCCIIIIYFLNRLLNDQVNLVGNVLVGFKIGLEALFWLLFSFLTFHFTSAIAESIINTSNAKKIGLEATYTRAIFMVLSTILTFFVIVFGLSQIGLAVLPLVTGVGIGGIAIALAIRPTLENIIASFTIFADKPYRVNDRVQVLNYNGTIESIGIRSTRIRLLSGPLVTVPNEKMATVEIENIQKRPYLKRDFNIKIKHESSIEIVEKSVQIIKDVLAVPMNSNTPDHPNHAINNMEFPPKVFFNQINNDSFNIYVVFWYFPAEWWDFMEFSEKINFKIIKSLKEASIDFAFPTQTLQLQNSSKSKASTVD